MCSTSVAKAIKKRVAKFVQSKTGSAESISNEFGKIAQKGIARLCDKNETQPQSAKISWPTLKILKGKQDPETLEPRVDIEQRFKVFVLCLV